MLFQEGVFFKRVVLFQEGSGFFKKIVVFFKRVVLLSRGSTFFHRVVLFSEGSAFPKG